LNSSFEIFLGLRYLRSRRKRSAISVLTWISVLGVAIGVMALNWSQIATGSSIQGLMDFSGG
jgi:ABC-type lipoprotein release transport system permease subunit